MSKVDRTRDAMSTVDDTGRLHIPAGLSVRDLSVEYGGVAALRAFDLDVEPGSVLAVLGPNGAGKSTLARALMGLVPAASGSIVVDGNPVGRLRPERRVRLGIGLLPDFRAVFPGLTVRDNLRVAFHREGKGAVVRQRIEAAYAMFPVLKARAKLPAGNLSGGEQQMLAISRIVVSPPRLLIIDEISHGLAPGVVDRLFGALAGLRGSCTMVVIEQFISRAITLADDVIVLSRGVVVHRASARDVTAAEVASHYRLADPDGLSRGDRLP
jgi:branched-chain amino acid transport system ATP-binding protein